MMNGLPIIVLQLNALSALAILAIGRGKGAAAAPVILHRVANGSDASSGLFGLIMFFLCMLIVIYAWQRLRNRTNP